MLFAFMFDVRFLDTAERVEEADTMDYFLSVFVEYIGDIAKSDLFLAEYGKFARAAGEYKLDRFIISNGRMIKRYNESFKMFIQT